MILHQAGPELVRDQDFSLLFRDWLAGRAALGPAMQDLGRFLSPAAATRPAPVWADSRWRAGWMAELAEDLPDEESRQRLAENVGRLAAGAADLVITGQQPGFLGGPLYTLFKVATAVAAAVARSAAGRPTLPLFWSADDDDDWREALEPWLWDPRRRTFLHAQPPAEATGNMVGAAPAAVWGVADGHWLDEQAERHPLAADLAALWVAAIWSGSSWGRLQRRALLRVFRGTGLLMVSGNDPALHAAASPFYERLAAGRGSLVGGAHGRGAELSGLGYHAQIQDSSLERFLYIAEGGRRLALTEDLEALPDASLLRPGVAARSLVQDWLFRPAGVVVGPGEVAYLKQLEPVYESFGVPRCPLLPRLFGQLAPPGVEIPLEESAPDPEDQAVSTTASGIAMTARASLAEALSELGTEPERAAELASHQAGRWEQAARMLLAKEMRRASARRGPEPVPWINGPRGQRQERILASHWATALWGDELVGALLRAAAAHLGVGRAGTWREYRIVVPALIAGQSPDHS
jgi:hypothetical protein